MGRVTEENMIEGKANLDRMDPSVRMALEMDQDFKALRHRYYKLGIDRRYKVLALLKMIPHIPERTLDIGFEKQMLFMAVAESKAATLKKLIEDEEAEIKAETEAL